MASKKLVHRDLAARNVLVGYNKILKISDFGLTRKLSENLVYMGSRGQRLPLKWMSLEAVFSDEFTMYSDVWVYFYNFEVFYMRYFMLTVLVHSLCFCETLTSWKQYPVKSSCFEVWQTYISLILYVLFLLLTLK